MDFAVTKQPKATAEQYLTIPDIKHLFTTAAASWAIEEAIPFRMFGQPTFCNMFKPLNSNADQIEME